MQLLSLLLLAAPVAVVTAAVSGCRSDRDKDHRTRYNCSEAGFSQVPPGIKPSTLVLLFPRNQFSSLSWSSFQRFAEIHELDLTGNQVPEVPPAAAPVLPTLSVLRLGWNRLVSLPDHAFSACPALTELHLENNLIRSLTDQTFSGLAKLEILKLSSNRIKVLPKLMLRPLPVIETLFLEFNQITVVPDDWFLPKEEVPYLYLSSNPWLCSCSLSYLHRYINEYFNVYVNDGPIVINQPESVVCDSPPPLKDKPLVDLDVESDLCPIEGWEEPEGSVPPITVLLLSTATPKDAMPYETTPLAIWPIEITSAETTPTEIGSTGTPPTEATSPGISSRLHTEVHRVVTRSWYQTFTHLVDWSVGSDWRGAGLGAGHTLASSFALSPTLTSATMTAAPPTQPRTTAPIHSAAVPTSATGAAATSAPPPWVDAGSRDLVPHDRVVGAFGGGGGVFCLWLFVACALLCAGTAACVVATAVRGVVWYRTVYKPLTVAAKRGGAGLRLLTYSRGAEPAAVALYRSVLFVHRDGAGKPEGAGGGQGAEPGGGDRVPVPLEPAMGGAERTVYKNTLHRLVGREEAVPGWRAEPPHASGGGAASKRYSVILREERGEGGGGGAELQWVVGGWEVKGEGAESRSSWGEWLVSYLPSMPWTVATPPEGEAAP